MKQESPESATMLGDPTLLETIDQLFACNVGQYINLPQLVVVGDQSSGKSSVLEGLTKLSFPRDSGLCTRFATQIVFRRQASLTERYITACIIPGDDVNVDSKPKIEAWKAQGLETLGHDGFNRMMAEVHDVMGLSTTTGDCKPTFASSVLKLEICGPNENHLSVIDVPGIFRTPSPGRTTLADRDMVRSMVLQYMQNPRSVMLTVVPANVDLATQEIIHLASEADPAEERTLKILTKPDLVDRGAEEKIIEMINDGNRSDELGWVVVKNAGQKELDQRGFNRDQAERAFFQTVPWNSLPEENCGIKPLMQRLQELLTAIVTREYPKVIQEISRALSNAKKELAGLGADRDTPAQQRSLLMHIVTELKNISTCAIDSNYGAHEAFKEKRSLRLSTIVQNRNTEYSNDLALWGHLYEFQADKSAHGNENGRFGRSEAINSFVQLKCRKFAPKPAKEKATFSQPEQGKKKNDPPRAKSFLGKSLSFDDLESILPESSQVPGPRESGIIPWLETQHRDYRGFEIGTFNSNLLTMLMKTQSSKWPMITGGYISDMIITVHRFILCALEEICTDEKISSGIMSALREKLMEKYQVAISKMSDLLKTEREGLLMTMNHYFNDNLQKSRQERLREELGNKVFSSDQHGDLVRVADLLQSHDMSNSQHTVLEIHDILHAYYKVARKRFTDNVCMQASYALVTSNDSPLELFSHSWVNGLSDTQLEKLAGDDNSTRRRRQRLRKVIADLEAGKRCLTY